MSGPKGGERQQHAAAVMEGLLHTEHNNTIVIWDLPNALTPPCALPSFFHLPLLCTYITLKKDFCRELQNVLKDIQIIKSCKARSSRQDRAATTAVQHAFQFIIMQYLILLHTPSLWGLFFLKPNRLYS